MSATKKLFLITMLILTAIAVFILSCPILEIFFGIEMPFVLKNNGQFSFLTHNISNENELIFSTILIMLFALPLLVIGYLLLIKLTEDENPNIFEILKNGTIISSDIRHHSSETYKEDGSMKTN